jgi:polyhydroxyalkanoate synthesis regulator phasin
MAKKKKEKEREADAGTLGRLSKAGEDALTRLMEELGKNERLTDALGRATSAKGKLDESAKRAVTQVGLAAADELRDLRKHVERLEKRVATLEAEAKKDAKPRSPAKPRASKPSTSSTAPAKKAAEESASPAPGRAVGGGTSRGAGSGGTPAS